jgi:cyanophycinase
VSGALALVGGGEFLPPLLELDRALLDAAGTSRVHAVLAAAARQGPERALETARKHFTRLGAAVEASEALTPAQANRPEVAGAAKAARYIYLVGGDPGHLLKTLTGSLLWQAILSAWASGASLAGSSAGAMVMGSWCLTRAAWPDPTVRRFQPGLNLVPGLAIVPHLDESGRRWLPSVLESAPDGAIVVGIDSVTAAVWRSPAWQVEGAGIVERFTRSEEAASPGQGIDLPAPVEP